jgi:hypothetical protein
MAFLRYKEELLLAISSRTSICGNPAFISFTAFANFLEISP